MRFLPHLIGAGAAAFALAACQNEVAAPKGENTPPPSFANSSTGNGAPSGTHFNLNIIGVPKDKTADMDDNNGRRIFVQLFGGDSAGALNGKLFKEISKINKIFLQPAPAGESFNVLDANATDADGARFQLPADVSTTYAVYARALGKPGGISFTTTCATEAGADGILGTDDDEVICSTATLRMERTKGKQSFTNVSAELLFITITVDPATDPVLAACLGITTTQSVMLPLFHACLQNFFWNYDNHGLKLLQLRFYPIES
ncbi:MAG TPA: hypothetical protein VKD28_01405 [Gemmatimonadales bacterium]|nr:hypothetical protein [Gemmatimonadales bacterium]